MYGWIGFLQIIPSLALACTCVSSVHNNKILKCLFQSKLERENFWMWKTVSMCFFFFHGDASSCSFKSSKEWQLRRQMALSTRSSTRIRLAIKFYRLAVYDISAFRTIQISISTWHNRQGQTELIFEQISRISGETRKEKEYKFTSKNNLQNGSTKKS